MQMIQLMSLSPVISCFIKTQNGHFPFSGWLTAGCPVKTAIDDCYCASADWVITWCLLLTGSVVTVSWIGLWLGTVCWSYLW